MKVYKEIQSFVRNTRGRLNLGVHLKSISYGVLAASCIMMLIAMGFVFKGFKVDMKYVVPALAVGLAVYLVVWWKRRISYKEAARFADDEFDVKDGISSAISFKEQGKEGGIYDLQLDDTGSKVRGVDHRKVSIGPDWPSIRVSTVCVAAIFLLSLFPESSSVKAARLMRADTVNRTEEIKEHLKEEIEEIEKELAPEEREIFNKSKLAELVESLDKTEDRKEALRKYAEIEKAIRDASSQNSTYEDERVLQAMANELNKGKEAKELAKSIKEKNYKDAAKELQKMKPDKKEAMKRFQEKLAAMKKAANKMKNAAENCSSANNKFSKSACEMSEAASEMSKATSKMTEAEMSECKTGSCKKKKGGCKACEAGDKMKACVGKASDDLKDLDSRRAVLSALGKLRAQMGMCQAYLLAQAQMQGGKKAGVGSVWKKNEKKPEDSSLGYNTEVDPQKGEGPTRVAVEDAASGGGVRRVGSREKTVEFKYQVESFMRREDVSESFKNGVKTYFEIIHEEE